MGGSKAELQKTLETCTKELLRVSKYSSDVRFLRLWIQYVSADCDSAAAFIIISELLDVSCRRIAWLTLPTSSSSFG